RRNARRAGAFLAVGVDADVDPIARLQLGDRIFNTVLHLHAGGFHVLAGLHGDGDALIGVIDSHGPGDLGRTEKVRVRVDDAGDDKVPGYIDDLRVRGGQRFHLVVGTESHDATTLHRHGLIGMPSIVVVALVIHRHDLPIYDNLIGIAVLQNDSRR